MFDILLKEKIIRRIEQKSHITEKKAIVEDDMHPTQLLGQKTMRMLLL